MKECFIQTYTGTVIDLFNLDQEDIKIEDIAHSLALTNRYGGHSLFPFSVAQHCVVGLKLIPDEDKLLWLLHDAAEAYVSDIPRPIKYILKDYIELENDILKVILYKYGLTLPFPKHIKFADNLMLVTEAKTLMKENYNWKAWCDNIEPIELPIKYWSWEKAKYEFMSAFKELYGKDKNKN